MNDTLKGLFADEIIEILCSRLDIASRDAKTVSQLKVSGIYTEERVWNESEYWAEMEKGADIIDSLYNALRVNLLGRGEPNEIILWNLVPDTLYKFYYDGNLKVTVAEKSTMYTHSYTIGYKVSS